MKCVRITRNWRRIVGMRRNSSFGPQQIVKKLGEAEVLLSQGATVGEAARKIGVTDENITIGEENTVG